MESSDMFRFLSLCERVTRKQTNEVEGGDKKIYEKNQRRWEEVPKKTMKGGRRLPTASLGVKIIRD